MASGTLAPSPWLTVENASGIPYVGAKVTTYLAGTTTPAATYSDVGLTTANSNPIITDSAGRYVAFLPPGTSFKFVVTDANDVAIRTQDNISAVPASSANLDITGTAGQDLTAGQAVYLSDGSGSMTAGQWFKADSTNTYSSSAAVSVGMVPADISSGASGTIRLAGQMTGLTLTIGTTYYAGTAGALTATQPTNARVIGIADSTSTLVLNANPGTPTADNGVNDFRLTLTTATPVTSTDVTAATTIYCTPYRGTRMALFDSAGNATLRTSAEFSIAVPATTSQMYDVFAYSNSGVPTLELLATSRTDMTGLTLATTGVYTKTGDLTRRWLGSFRTTAVSGQTEDSASKRYLFNYYNRVPRTLQRTTTGSWTYTSATKRQANADTANQVEIVVGAPEMTLDLRLLMLASNANSGSAAFSVVGIGEDSTTTFTGLNNIANSDTAGNIHPVSAMLVKMPAVGRHVYSWNEAGDGANVTTFFANSLTSQSGLVGVIQ